MGSGRLGARIGSHRCSLSTACAYSAAPGIRTSMSAPSRNERLSQPGAGTGRTGSPAHRGNWSATRRATTAGSTSMRVGTGPRFIGPTLSAAAAGRNRITAAGPPTCNTIHILIGAR